MDVGIPQERDPRNSGNGRLEKLDLFDAQVGTQGRHARDVPARSGEARNEAQLNRIRRVHHDNGDVRGRSLGAQYGSWIGRDDNVDLQANQVQGERIEQLSSSLGVSNLENNISAFDVSQGVQALLKCLCSKACPEHTDSIRLCRLLRLGVDRGDQQSHCGVQKLPATNVVHVPTFGQ